MGRRVLGREEKKKQILGMEEKKANIRYGRKKN